MLRAFSSLALFIRRPLALASVALAATLSACADDPTQPVVAKPSDAASLFDFTFPLLSVTPSSHDFGTVYPWDPSPTKVVKVTNSGTGSLQLSDVQLVGKDANEFYFAYDTPQPYCSNNGSYGAGQSCYLGFRFAAASPGTDSALVWIESNGGVQAVTLTGTVLPAFQVTPDLLSFGTQLIYTQSAPQAVHVTNISNKTITIDSYNYNEPGDFVVVGGSNNACVVPGPLAAGASCDIMMAFKPSSPRVFAANLVIHTNLGDGVTGLLGIGVQPQADVGVTMTGTLQAKTITYGITVKNWGPTAATNITLADTIPTGATYASVSAPSGVTCAPPNTGGTNSLNCSIASLAVGASATVKLAVKVATGTSQVVNSAKAIVSYPLWDPIQINNTATVTTIVGRK